LSIRVRSSFESSGQAAVSATGCTALGAVLDVEVGVDVLVDCGGCAAGGFSAAQPAANAAVAVIVIAK
jgi:hypothetical protein